MTYTDHGAALAGAAPGLPGRVKVYEFEILFVGKSDVERYQTADYHFSEDGWLYLDDVVVNLANVLWYTKTFGGGQ